MRPRVILVFLDGVGIGGRRQNPFFAARMPVLLSLLGGRMISLRDPRRRGRKASVVPLNATLRVGGLPQSGTGQAALLTGLNAPKLIGRHFGPYPYSTLRPVVAERSIFSTLRRMGRRPFYANAFPARYFEYFRARPAIMPAIASAWEASGGALNDAAALLAGRALSADLTNARWPSLGYPDIPAITAEKAGERLARMAEEHDFVLFEYYMTDKAGHRQGMDEAVAVLESLDAFLGGILHHMDAAGTLCLVTSDHGNMEDLSVRTHTRNPVPLLAFGRGHAAFTARARDLTHPARIIAELLR